MQNTEHYPTYSAEIVYPKRRADREAGIRWLEFECPRCHRRHRHGWPADEPAPIHRVKHCHGLGYWLAPDSAIAKRIEPQLKEAAREKQRAAGGDKKSGRASLPHPIPEQGKAREQAAKIMNVSPRSVSDAKAAREKQREAGEHGVEGGRGRKKNPSGKSAGRVFLLVSGGRSTGPSMTSSTPVHREQHCHGLGYWLAPDSGAPGSSVDLLPPKRLRELSQYKTDLLSDH